VFLAPSLVQGEGAAEAVAESIRLLDAAAERFGIDTILVARGGGSLEDLWAFNEEVVARAIFTARTPIISGIGHEVDITIADLVADLRAPTPTGAAELAVPDQRDVRRVLETLQVRLGRRAAQTLESGRLALSAVRRSVVFRDPTWRCRMATQQVDELSHRLARAASERATAGRRRLEPAANRLAALHPARLLEKARSQPENLLARMRWALGGRSRRGGEKLLAVAGRLKALHPARLLEKARSQPENLLARMRWALGGRSRRGGEKLLAVAGRLNAAHPSHRVVLARQRTEAAARQLDALSYRRVIKRGFSVTRRQDGRILRSFGEVRDGDWVRTELADGKIDSQVGQRTSPGISRRAKQRPDDAPGLFEKTDEALQQED